MTSTNCVDNTNSDFTVINVPGMFVVSCNTQLTHEDRQQASCAAIKDEWLLIDKKYVMFRDKLRAACHDNSTLDAWELFSSSSSSVSFHNFRVMGTQSVESRDVIV